MPSMPKGNSGLFCQPASPCTMGFFVMDHSTTQDLCVCRSGCSRCIGAPCSITSPALPALDCAWLHGRDRLLTQSVPGLLNTHCAAVFCLARCPRFNPHSRPALLHPAL